eukprot:scaffold3826_cov407-Prasinococcus_capsulatus_cf.AAC.26
MANRRARVSERAPAGQEAQKNRPSRGGPIQLSLGVGRGGLRPVVGPAWSALSLSPLAPAKQPAPATCAERHPPPPALDYA